MSLVPPTRDERPQITSYKPGAVRSSVGTGGFNNLNNDQAFNFKDFLYAIRQHKILIIVMLLAFTFLSIGGTYFWKAFAPTWTATAKVLVRIPRKKMAEGTGTTSASKDQIERIVGNKMSLILSEPVLKSALRSSSVRKTKWPAEHPINTIVKLRKKLSVSPQRGSELINIRFSDRNPEVAAIIANAIATEALKKNKANDEYYSYQRDLKSYNNQRKAFETKLKKTQTDLKLMRDRRSIANTRQDIDTLQAGIANTSKKIATKIADMKEAYQRYESIKNQSDEELATHPEVQQSIKYNAEVQDARNIKDSLYRALKSDELRYGPEHKIRRNTQSQYDTAVEMYEQKRAKITKQAIASMKTAREEDYNALVASLSVLKQEQEVFDKELKSAKERRDKYQKLEEKEKEIELDIRKTDENISNVRMLMSNEDTMRRGADATIPRTPSWPRYSILVPLGVFLGLALGVGIAVLLEIVDNSVKNPTDVGRKINLPMLGMVPHTEDVFEHIYDLRLAFLKHPDTIIDEAFRQIRTNLMFSGFAEHRRSLLVTSPQPEDGRTSVALNLGNVMAKNGQRVLVIDANFRQPCFNELFPNVPQEGLSGTVTHHLDWRKQLTRVEPNMYVMCAGQRPKNPAELLGSETMRELLDELYDHFDQIIFDGAPCMVVSDSLILSTIVDGTVCVVRASENSTGIVLRMRNMLEKVGSHIYGVVLNGVRVTAGGYLRKNYETFYEYQESLALENKSASKPVESPQNHNQLPTGTSKFKNESAGQSDDISLPDNQHQGDEPEFIDHPPVD